MLRKLCAIFLYKKISAIQAHIFPEYRPDANSTQKGWEFGRYSRAKRFLRRANKIYIHIMNENEIYKNLKFEGIKKIINFLNIFLINIFNKK